MVLPLVAKVAAKLPLMFVLQPGETGVDHHMPNRHQQILSLPATTAAAVCLTATSSLTRAWVPILHFLQPAAHQYLSNSKVGPRKHGNTRAGPPVSPQGVQASTDLQGCQPSTSRATVGAWTVEFPIGPSNTIASALLSLQPVPLQHQSLLPTSPSPRASAPWVVTAAGARPWPSPPETLLLLVALGPMAAG